MNILKRLKSNTSAALVAKSELDAALGEIRANIAALEERREGASHARLSADEVRAAVKSHLDKLERDSLDRLTPEAFSNPDGAPDAERVFNILGTVGFAPAGGGGVPFYPKFEGVGALCVFGLRATVEKALVSHALAAANGGGASAAERAAALASIEAELEAAELAEEALIREAEAAGMRIARRHDANPAAYLRRQVA